MTDEYNDFEIFLRKVLAAVDNKESKLECWLGAAAAAFGAPAVARILPFLSASRTGGIAGVTTILSSSFLPLFGAALGASIGQILANFLVKAKSDEGKKITGNLLSAKSLYEEYAHSTLEEDKKKELIDDLFETLISEKDIIY